jgi:hypothetical protein
MNREVPGFSRAAMDGMCAAAWRSFIAAMGADVTTGESHVGSFWLVRTHLPTDTLAAKDHPIKTKKLLFLKLRWDIRKCMSKFQFEQSAIIA